MKCAIYTRYSTANQTENSTETQVNACVNFCKNNNFSIYNIYSDEERSGTNTDREQYQRLLFDAEKHMFDAILFYDMSRNSRDVVDWFNFRKKMKILNIEVISLHENLGDILDPNHFLSELLTIGINEHSVLTSRAKSIDGKYTKASHAMFLGGYAPFGYKIVNQKYEIDKEEAEIVHSIFAMFLSGEKITNIMNYLNSTGHIGRRGAKFTYSTIYGILKNERYMGKYKWMENITREMHKPVNKKNKKPVIIENAIPQIVTRDMFLEAQECFKNKKTTNNKSRQYLLSNLIECEKCGNKYFGRTTKSSKGYTSFYYVCSGKYEKKICDAKNINGFLIEEKVANAVREWLRACDMNKLEEIFTNFNEKVEDAKLKERLLKINKESRNIIDILKTKGDVDVLVDELKRLENEKKEIENTIQSQSQLIYCKDFIYTTILEVIKAKQKDVDKLSNETLIRDFVSKIIAHDNETASIIVSVCHFGSPGVQKIRLTTLKISLQKTSIY